MQISALQSLYTSYIKSSHAQEANTSANTESSNPAYQLDLSPQAKKVMAEQASKPASIPETFRSKILEQPENQNLANNVHTLEKNLNSFLMSHNIDNLDNYQFEYHENNTVSLRNSPYNKKEIETAINSNRDLVTEIRNVLAESQIAAANHIQQQYREVRQQPEVKADVEKLDTIMQRSISSQRILSTVGGYFSLTGGKLNINSISTAQNIILM